jgi:hypothetical protein
MPSPFLFIPPGIYHRPLKHSAPKSAKELSPLSRSPKGGDGGSGTPLPISQNIAVLSVKVALVHRHRATDESDCTVRSLDNDEPGVDVGDRY